MAAPFYPGLASCLWKARAASAPSPSHYKEALYFPRRFCLFCRAARPAAVVSHLRPPWPGSPLPGFASSSSGGGSSSSEAARAAVRAGRSARLIIGAATAAPRGGGGRPELHLLRLGQHPSSAPLKPHPTRPPETPIDLGLCGTPNRTAAPDRCASALTDPRHGHQWTDASWITMTASPCIFPRVLGTRHCAWMATW